MSNELSKYMKTVTTDFPLLKGIEDEYPLIERAQAGDTEARDILILSNLRLVIYVAKPYLKTNIPPDDLLQEGSVGLFKAIEKFDTSSNNKFSTYATWWIRQNITRYISNHSRTVKIPIKMSELLSKYNKAVAKLGFDYGREPTIDELADYLEVKPERIEKMIYANQAGVSLNKPFSGYESDGRDVTLGDIIEDVNKDVDIISEQNSLSDKMNEALLSLTEDERYVIVKLFGFYDDKRATKIQISKDLGLSNTAQVTKLEKAAKAKIKVYMGEHNPYE